MYYFKLTFVTDVSNQTDLLLVNLKEVIGDFQAERNYFKTQVEKLQIEKKIIYFESKLVRTLS